MFNRNASAAVTQMQTKHRRELLPERHSPHPPYTRGGYKIFQKTLQINSLREENPARKKCGIPASLLAKSWFHPKPRMCAKSQ
jgi:hypothetical protein